MTRRPSPVGIRPSFLMSARRGPPGLECSYRRGIRSVARSSQDNYHRWLRGIRPVSADLLLAECKLRTEREVALSDGVRRGHFSWCYLRLQLLFELVSGDVGDHMDC
jgi:hypothetical protein